MNVAVLFSGGKDSVFALSWALQQGWDVRCLLTLKSKNTYSYMFHTPNILLTSEQAKALELPLLEQETGGEKESELRDLVALFRRAKNEFSLTGIIVGALFSDYQHERVNRICHEIGLKTFAPLWHVNQSQLLREMIDAGFEIIISAIAAEGLSQRWLGRRLDASALHELDVLHTRFGLHPAGEGGEYESLVLNGPIFNKRIVIEKAHLQMSGDCEGVYVVEKVRLI